MTPEADPQDLSPRARAVLGTFDHAVLKPEATEDDVKYACALGVRLAVATVCVQPCWAPLAVAELQGAATRPSSVVGFPLGVTTSEAKLLEAIALVEAGVAELDAVINVGWVRSGHWQEVSDELGALSLVCSSAGVLLKVILETCYLDDEQKRRAAVLAAEVGADFVKTSTGFGPAGATVEDVRLLRETVPEKVGVKAAGGIRTLGQAEALLAAGASRIGTSSTAAIARELGVEV